MSDELLTGLRERDLLAKLHTAHAELAARNAELRRARAELDEARETLERAAERADALNDRNVALAEENEQLRQVLDGARALIHTIDNHNPGGFAVGAVLAAIGAALGSRP